MDLEQPDDDVSIAMLDATYAPFADADDWRITPAGAADWARVRKRLAKARGNAEDATFERLMHETLRQAAIDTGAIEGLYATDRGFTINVAKMAATWIAEIEQTKGRDVAALVEAQLDAYEMALDAATTRQPLTEAWLRDLHIVVCRAQDTYDVRTPNGPQQHRLPKGEYKTAPNHVLTAEGALHPYAPVADTPHEMRRLVEVLRGTSFDGLHPAIQAAYAHHALTHVHPFADGNGRTARVLASVFLLRALSLPLVVFADQRVDYLDALEAADTGRPAAFVEFVSARAIDTALVVTDRLESDADDPVARLTRLQRTTDGVAWERLPDAVSNIRGHIDGVLDQLAARLAPAAEVTIEFSNRMVGYPSILPGWTLHPDGTSSTAEMLAWIDVPFSASARGRAITHLRPDLATSFALAISWEPGQRHIELRASDCYPKLTEATKTRIENWLEQRVKETLQELADTIDARLRGETRPDK